MKNLEAKIINRTKSLSQNISCNSTKKCIFDGSGVSFTDSGLFSENQLLNSIYQSLETLGCESPPHSIQSFLSKLIDTNALFDANQTNDNNNYLSNEEEDSFNKKNSVDRLAPDSNPEIINKRTLQQIEYIQELAIRYLRPPTPPAPGEIVITQLPNVLTPPAPPIVVRQQPPRPATPEPLVIKEFYLIFFHFIYFLIVDVLR